MRLLSKFLLISVAGLAVAIAALAGIGIGVIDNVVYRNHAQVLRIELASIERQLDTRSARIVIPHETVLQKLEGLDRVSIDSYFA
jgi:hypothetical protein